MNFFAITGILITLTAFIESIIMFYKGREKIHFLWGIFIFAVMIWGVGVILIANSKDPALSSLYWKLSYVGVVFMPAFLIHFTFTFLKIKKRILITFLYFLSIFFVYLLFFTDLFIYEVDFVFDQFYYISSPPIYYNLFVLIFVFSFFYALCKMYKEYKKSSGINKIQIKYLFLGLLIAVVGGSSSYFPVYGLYVYPYFNITIAIGIILVGYGVFKYHLMNVRVLLSQIISVFFIFISFYALFLNQYQNFTFKIIAFLVSLFLVILLLYSTNAESLRLKEIEQLNRKLTKASKVIKQKNKNLQALLNMKTEFLRVVHHQLNTPLSIMRNSFAMAEEKVIKPAKALKIAKSGLDRLSQTIEDFWQAYEMEGEKIKVKKEKTDITDMIRQQAEEKKKMSKFKQKKLKIKIKKPDFKIPKVMADPKKIIHVISNLLDNAVFYTDQGSIIISYQKKDKNLRVNVKDTGIGITAEDKDRLFKKFSRGVSATQVSPDGSGLGLYIAKKIIDAHNGDIGVDSEGQGKGSTFYFTLPLAK